MINIYKKDALIFLDEIESSSVDMIFTDPPYWTLNKWRNMGSTTRLGGNHDTEKQKGWFNTIDSDELWDLMVDMYRILKKDRHAFLMCDGQTLKWVLGYAEESGFNYCKPIVWDKVHLGMGYHFRNRHEFIVMLDKGKNRKPKDSSISDIISIPMVKNGYPTEKPQKLIDIFVEQFTQENELVVDPFYGSGVVALSCKKYGRRFDGTDISDVAFDYAKKRLDSPLELFSNN
jgi:site-specific DNA-methyltransferase (adenine-specific)